MTIRRCLAYEANDSVNEKEVTVWVDVDEAATPFLAADRHEYKHGAGWTVTHAEWVEMPGQGALL